VQGLPKLFQLDQEVAYPLNHSKKHSVEAKKVPQSISVHQTIDSYRAHVVMDVLPVEKANRYVVVSGLARRERRLSNTQNVRRGEGNLPMSYQPLGYDSHSGLRRGRENVVKQEELDTGNEIQNALLDATSTNSLSLGTDISKRAQEMPESFGFLSEEDLNFQGIVGIC
jgi:hypothetical protein